MGLKWKTVLNQVNVVTRHQVLHIILFSNVDAHLKIVGLDPDSSFGPLQKQTKLKILRPSGTSEKRIVKERKRFTVSVYHGTKDFMHCILLFLRKFLQFYFSRKFSKELTKVFVLAATSRPDLLNPPLLRPGRVDRAIHCALPTEKERLSILKAMSGNLQFSDNVDLGKLAKMAQDYAGANLRAVLYAAQMALIKKFVGIGSDELRSEKFVIENKHLLAGLSHTRPAMSTGDKEIYK